MTQIQVHGAFAPSVGSLDGQGGGALTPAVLSDAAKRLFTQGPLLLRKLQHFRPYICPFEQVIQHIPRGSTVLDVGCGGGLFLGLLHAADVLNRMSGPNGAGGVGFDCSKSAIQVAQQMSLNAQGGARLRFEHKDVTEAWPEGPFDVVSIIDVMHHVPTECRKSLLTQAVERIRPGGRLVYKDMTSRSWRSVANQIHDLTLARQFIRYTPIETIERWGTELGLRVIHSNRFNRLWYGHELLVFAKPEIAVADAA